jgi:hypothetical protein
MALPTPYDALVVFLVSAVISLVIFPIVLLCSLHYSGVCKKNPKLPKILVMLYCTFIGVLLAMVILYFYIGYAFLPAANPAAP